jgi:hypothetical protein
VWLLLVLTYVLAVLLPVQSSNLIKKEENGHRISRMTVYTEGAISLYSMSRRTGLVTMIWNRPIDRLMLWEQVKLHALVDNGLSQGQCF